MTDSIDKVKELLNKVTGFNGGIRYDVIKLKNIKEVK